MLYLPCKLVGRVVPVAVALLHILGLAVQGLLAHQFHVSLLLGVDLVMGVVAVEPGAGSLRVQDGPVALWGPENMEPFLQQLLLRLRRREVLRARYLRPEDEKMRCLEPAVPAPDDHDLLRLAPRDTVEDAEGLDVPPFLEKLSRGHDAARGEPLDTLELALPELDGPGAVQQDHGLRFHGPVYIEHGRAKPASRFREVASLLPLRARVIQQNLHAQGDDAVLSDLYVLQLVVVVK